MIVLEILLGLLLLVLLVVVHELGHGIAARRNGVVVKEFGVGFPPKAWGRKVAKSFLGKNVLFSVNWLPIGGFVRLKGEHDAADKPGDYGAASYWQKTKILFAGVFINWLVAAVLLTILALVGLPKIVDNQVTIPGDTRITTSPVEIATVVDDMPAKQAGLMVGDQILRFNGQSVASATALTREAERLKGQTIEVIYSRGGKEQTTKLTLRSDNADRKGYLGVGSGQRETIHATWSAPLVGVATTGQFTWLTLKGVGEVIGNFFGGLFMQLSFNQSVRDAGSANIAAAGASVSSPIAIVGILFPAAERAGVAQVVFLTAIISLSLAVMNILPIPALDGGRWYTMTLFRLLKKPLTKQREESIQTVSFLVLMALFVLVIIADVGKFF